MSPAAHRARPASRRGHLAVDVPGCVLAARPGDHGRHRRRRRGAVGHQGEGRRAAAVPTAGRREPGAHRDVRTRQRAGHTRAARLRTGLGSPRAVRRPHPVRRPGLKAVYGVSDTDDTGAPVLHQQARPLVEDSGLRRRTCAMCRPCSRRYARSSGPSCRCSTTPTTGSPRSRPPGSARTLSPTGRSGWRTAPRPRTRRRCAWSAGPRRRRWPWARSSTRCTTTRPWSPSS